MPETLTCGACGDVYMMPPVHDCWLIKKMNTQETLPAPDQGEYLNLEQSPEDAKVSVRMRQLDMSSY